MLSDVRKRKLTRVFRVFDKNGDGRLQASDYEAFAHSVAEARGFQEGAPGYSLLSMRYQAMWESLRTSVELDEDGAVSLEQFLKSREEMLRGQTPEQFAEERVGPMMALLDLDGDGVLSPTEFHQFKDIFYGGEAGSAETFKKLDLNDDGVISREEMLQHIISFFFSDDPDAAGNWLYGKF
jgi:Ca2+-binding EF-hand superfamily protein